MRSSKLYKKFKENMADLPEKESAPKNGQKNTVQMIVHKLKIDKVQIWKNNQ